MLLVAFGVVTVFAVIMAFTRPDPAQTVVRFLLVMSFTALPWGAVQIAGVPLGDVPLIIALLIMAVLYLPRARLYLPVGIPMGALMIAVSGLLTAALPPSAAYVDSRYTIDLRYLVTAGVELRSLSNLGTLFKYEISLVVLPLVAVLAIGINSKLAKQLATAWVAGVLISDLVAYTDSIGVTSISNALLGYVNAEPRFSGLTPQPNFVGVQTAMVLPLILLAFRGPTVRRRVCAGVALGIAAMALLSSGSRGSAVAAMIAVPLTLLAVPAVRSWIGRTTFLVVAGVAVVLVTPFGAKVLTSVRLTGGAEGVDQSDGDRLASRHQAFADIAYSPLHGIGWGHSIDAHMIYLQVFAAGGVLGGVGFLWYVGNAVVRAWSDLRTESVLAGGLLASALTWLVLGLVENQLTDQWAHVPFALLLAMIARRHDMRRPPIQAGRPERRPTSMPPPRRQLPASPKSYTNRPARPLPSPLPIAVAIETLPCQAIQKRSQLFVADDVGDALGWIARWTGEPSPTRGYRLDLDGGPPTLFVVVVDHHMLRARTLAPDPPWCGDHTLRAASLATPAGSRQIGVSPPFLLALQFMSERGKMMMQSRMLR